MQITKSDKLNCDNLIKLLKRAKIELQGAEEILGSAELLKWISGLSSRIDKDIKDQEEKAKAMEAVVKAEPALDPAAPMTLNAPKAPSKKSKSKKGE